MSAVSEKNAMRNRAANSNHEVVDHHNVLRRAEAWDRLVLEHAPVEQMSRTRQSDTAGHKMQLMSQLAIAANADGRMQSPVCRRWS